MAENTNNSSYRAEEESNITFADLWALFWKHKIWYAVTVILCLLFAAFYMYRTPNSYSRSTKVLIDESNQDATMRNLGVASAGMMRLRSFNSVENEIEAFSSPDLMQTVVERLNLQTTYVEKQFLRKVELYHYSPVELVLAGENPVSGFSFTVTNLGGGNISMTDFVLGPDKFKDTVKGRLNDTIVTPVGSVMIYLKGTSEEFKHPIRISWASSAAVAKRYCASMNTSLSSKESSVIVISKQDIFPERASSILATLVDVYNEVWINNKNRAAIKTTEFINERLSVIENDLSMVEDALKNYKASNNLTDVKAIGQSYLEESSKYATKAFEINNQLQIATYIKDYLNDPRNAMSLIPSNLGLTNISVETQIAEYNNMALKRDRLIATSSENNPLISDLEAAINSVRDAILRSVENLVATLTMQLEKVESQERSILNRISSNSGQELKLLSIERQQQITQNLYVFLLQKREENELAALVNVGNTRVLMRPSGPSNPDSPNRMMIVLVALVFGLGIPFGFFFLLKMLDNTVKVKSDLGRITVPFLAEIPCADESSKRTFLNRRKIGKNVSYSNIIVQPGKRDVMNEAFRVLRTNVDLALGFGQPSKVVMFTSFNPGAGKTFNILNLAASMSLKNSRVLLLDLDLRMSTLSRGLGVIHSGVASYLNGKHSDFTPYVDEIMPNLFILPVGSLPPNPTELLLSDRFASLIERCRKDYDYVFIDCPPIDIVADSSIITKYVDMTVFVLRAGLFDKNDIPLLEEIYKSGKYKSMAIVLNDVDFRAHKYGPGRYGSRGYGYGNQD